MLIILIAAPVIGLVIGAVRRRIVGGLLIGLAVGAGNYALWSVYNALTDRMGLDTVKNLVVNLVLFVVVGVAVGGGVAWYQTRQIGDRK